MSSCSYRFNSKLVRLKVRSLFFWVVGSGEFQFQTGAIKRMMDIRNIVCLNWFQFQTGAIKRWISTASP